MTIRKAEVLSVALALAGVLSLSATEYTLKAGLKGQVDLTSPGSYEEGAAPKAGDSIKMQNWVSGKGYTYVTNSIAADPASWELLKSLESVFINYGDTFALVVDGEADAYDLPCKINGSSKFAKLGPKRLNLTSHSKLSGSYYKDYEAPIDVLEGTLALPQDINTTGGNGINLGALYVAAGATLVTASGTPSSGTTGVMTVPGPLSGAGLITNEMPLAGSVMYDFRIAQTARTEFSGAVGGPIRFRVQSGPLSLVGAAMAHTKTTESGAGATIESDDLQNFGTGAFAIGTSGGTYRYVGTVPHEFDKQFTVTASPAVLDGGDFGGLTFSGYFSAYSSTASQNLIYLAGDGAEPNHFTGKVWQQAPAAAGKTVPYCMIKRGKGTWTFNGSQAAPYNTTRYNLCGTLAVEAGTLEFGSIAPRGVNCALGYGDACYECKAGAVSSLATVPYCYLLGATDDAQRAAEGEARFVYTGEASAQVTDRPIAVRNDAVLGVTQAAKLRWFDVTGTGAGAKTLALEAADGTAGELFDVVDSAEAPVSIEKRGEGTWRIEGDHALHGGVAVSGGELSVKDVPDGSDYKWFRLIVKETAATCARYPAFNSASETTVAIGEIALYDSLGHRLGLYARNADDELSVEPGCACFGDRDKIYSIYKACCPSNYFDNAKVDAAGNYGHICRVTLKSQVKLGEESTWWTATVFRLPDDAAQVYSWDMVSTEACTNGAAGSGCPWQVTAARLQGSTDGVHWETVSDVDEIDPRHAYYWVSNDKVWYADSTQTRSFASGNGWALTRRTAERTTAPWTSLASVSVATNGTLVFEGTRPTTSKLVVDVAGVGAISNVALAKTGTLEVTNLPKTTVKIPMDFSGITDSENLADWTLVADGQELTGKRDFTVGPDGITIYGKGLSIIIK